MNVYGGRHSRCNYKVIIFPLAARPGEVTARIRISISWSDFCLFDTRINFVAITIRNYVNSAAHSLCAVSILWCQTQPVCRTYGTSGPSTWYTPTRLRSYRDSYYCECLEIYTLKYPRDSKWNSEYRLLITRNWYLDIVS